MSPHYLIKGQTITITSEEAGTSHGEVIESTCPALLPDLPFSREAPDAAQLRTEYGNLTDSEIVRTILQESKVRTIALIAHMHEGRPVCFVALGDGNGNWRDLQGAALAIQPIGRNFEASDIT